MAVMSKGVEMYLKEKEAKAQAKLNKLRKNKEEHKEVLIKMLTGYGFKNTDSYVEWLDLASGIQNIEFTKELIAEIPEEYKAIKCKVN